MKAKLFAEMMAGFAEAGNHRKGKRSKARVSRMALSPKKLKPAEIRRIRKSLKVSQPAFARYLGTSVAAVRSWEQGSRRPQKTALRLLTIAKENPAVLLEIES
jgi:putative transcriptional regulator